MTLFSATATTSTIFISTPSLGRWRRLTGRKARKRRPIHAANLPLAHDLGAERFIEGDRRRIPVEHRPFEARVAVVDAGARQLLHQGLADTAAAEFGPNEHVLEID